MHIEQQTKLNKPSLSQPIQDIMGQQHKLMWLIFFIHIIIIIIIITGNIQDLLFGGLFVIKPGANSEIIECCNQLVVLPYQCREESSRSQSQKFICFMKNELCSGFYFQKKRHK